jgi:hypothetical protein
MMIRTQAFVATALLASQAALAQTVEQARQQMVANQHRADPAAGPLPLVPASSQELAAAEPGRAVRNTGIVLTSLASGGILATWILSLRAAEHDDAACRSSGGFCILTGVGQVYNASVITALLAVPLGGGIVLWTRGQRDLDRAQPREPRVSISPWASPAPGGGVAGLRVFGF